MMSYKTKDGKVTELTASGELSEMIGEAGFLIHAIYNMIAKSDEMAAEAFRYHFVMTVLDPESPMWEKGNPNCISIVQTGKPKEGKRDAE